jgi:hypothetical protein
VSSGYPILFLDVDGTLLPFGGDPVVGRLVEDVGVRLAALPCELVWATTWGEQANTDIGPRLGLPRLPVVRWESDPEPEDHWSGLHWKTRGLATWAANRPFAWLDDEISPHDRDWLHNNYPAPTLLQPVDPHQGVTPQTLTTLESWLHNL